MKKLIALVMVWVLSFAMAATVMARPSQIAESYDFTLEMQLGLNVKAPDLDQDMEVVLAFLRDIRLNVQGTTVTSSDALMFHMHMDVEMYAGLFYIPFSIWVDLDLSDLEDPVYIIVVEVPEILQTLIGLEAPELAKQYWVLDYGPFFIEAMEAFDTMGMVDTFDLMDDLINDFINLENVADMLPEMEYLGKNTFLLTVNDEDLTNIIIFSFEAAMDMILDMYAASLVPQSSVSFNIDVELTDEEIEEIVRIIGMMEAEGLQEALQFIEAFEELTGGPPSGVNFVSEADRIEDFYYTRAEQEDVMAEVMEMLYDIFDNVTFLSEDWVTYYIFNEEGYLIQETSRMQFIFDLLEWAAAFYYAGIPVAPDGWVPEIIITLDVNYTSVYENINTAGRVPLPEVTPENSVNIFELF